MSRFDPDRQRPPYSSTLPLRESVRRIVETGLDAARAGRIINLTGELGRGKTTAVTELERRARRTGLKLDVVYVVRPSNLSGPETDRAMGGRAIGEIQDALEKESAIAVDNFDNIPPPYRGEAGRILRTAAANETSVIVTSIRPQPQIVPSTRFYRIEPLPGVEVGDIWPSVVPNRRAAEMIVGQSGKNPKTVYQVLDKAHGIVVGEPELTGDNVEALRGVVRGEVQSGLEHAFNGFPPFVFGAVRQLADQLRENSRSIFHPADIHFELERLGVMRDEEYGGLDSLMGDLWNRGIIEATTEDGDFKLNPNINRRFRTLSGEK